MQKFCPECGTILGDKTKCDCGYDTITGKREIKEDDTSIYSSNNVFPRYANLSFEEKKKKMDEERVYLKDLLKRKNDIGDIISYSYTSSGGMMGSYYNLSFNFNDNKIEKQFQEWHHADRIKTVYSIDKENINKIKKLIIDNNISAWKNIPLNELYRAYDAPSVSTSFKFEKDTITINKLANIDEKALDVLTQIDKLIVLDDNNIISEEIVIDNGGKNFMGFGMIQEPFPKPQKPDTDEYNEYLHFCPECGSKMYKGIDKCITCGYIIPDDIKNK